MPWVALIWLIVHAYLAVRTVQGRRADQFPLWPRIEIDNRFSFHYYLMKSVGAKGTAIFYCIQGVIGSLVLVFLP